MDDNISEFSRIARANIDQLFQSMQSDSESDEDDVQSEEDEVRLATTKLLQEITLQDAGSPAMDSKVTHTDAENNFPDKKFTANVNSTISEISSSLQNICSIIPAASSISKNNSSNRENQSTIISASKYNLTDEIKISRVKLTRCDAEKLETKNIDDCPNHIVDSVGNQSIIASASKYNLTDINPRVKLTRCDAEKHEAENINDCPNDIGDSAGNKEDDPDYLIDSDGMSIDCSDSSDEFDSAYFSAKSRSSSRASVSSSSSRRYTSKRYVNRSTVHLSSTSSRRYTSKRCVSRPWPNFSLWDTSP